MKRLLVSSFLLALSINFRVQGQLPDKNSFPKIGYTSIDFVIGKLPESKVMQNQLEVTQAQLEKAIDDSIKEFQAKVDTYQKTGSQMTDLIRADKEKELENLQTRIQEMRNKAQNSLQTKQQQLLEPIIAKVNGAIQEVGKENSYVYVFNMDGGLGTKPFILFSASEENNLTSLVLKKLGVNPETSEMVTNPGTPGAKPGTSVPAKQNPASGAKKP